MISQLWVVRDPSPLSPDVSLSEFVYRMTPREYARYVIGTGLVNHDLENHTIHESEDSAHADMTGRIEKIESGVKAIRRQLRGSDPSLELVALWASLRAKASLDEIVDMVRQDLEASPVNTDHAQGLAGALMAACHAAESQ